MDSTEMNTTEMNKYARLVVGTDGSADAVAATRMAGLVGGRLDLPVEVITAYDGDDGHDHSWAQSVAAEAESMLTESGVADVTVSVKDGVGTEVLVDAAADGDALIVVGSTGLTKSASRIFGSASNRLSHHSRADVLFVRDPLPLQWNFVALATDGSPSSIGAVRRGVVLAQALAATPRLVTAASSQAEGDKVLSDTVADLEKYCPGIDFEREVIVNSDAAEAIVAKSWKWGVIVIGNKSMSGPARLLGSVANKVTHRLDGNLLLVNTVRTARN